MTMESTGINRIIEFNGEDGNYTGDYTVNRAIPHGLGRTPKIVYVRAGIHGGRIYNHDSHGVLYTPNGGVFFSLTLMDNVNFYVGDPSHSIEAGNGGGSPYYWIALG